MVAGKCPVCQNFVTVANGHPITINLGNGTTLRGVTFHCPNPMCNTVIGCQVDPISLKSDTVKEVAQSVGQIIAGIG